MNTENNIEEDKVFKEKFSELLDNYLKNTKPSRKLL